MLQMGQIYGQVSSSGQQPSAAAPPFYESAGQNRNHGVEIERGLVEVNYNCIRHNGGAVYSRSVRELIYISNRLLHIKIIH